MYPVTVDAFSSVPFGGNPAGVHSQIRAFPVDGGCGGQGGLIPHIGPAAVLGGRQCFQQAFQRSAPPLQKLKLEICGSIGNNSVHVHSPHII